MDSLLFGIRETENAWKQLFSVKTEFSEHLVRWVDDILYDKYDHNQFVPMGKITRQELQYALEYQKKNGWNFLKLDSREKQDTQLMKELELEEEETYTMLLGDKKRVESWKENQNVTVREIVEEDFTRELEELELRNFGPIYGEDFTKRNVHRFMEKAKANKEFHYFGAFLEEKLVGACYAYVHKGFVQTDGLLVEQAARKQYIATTLLKHIAQRFEERMFLHAAADDTPKEMYQRMGFETVDFLFEYTRIWSEQI